MPIQHAVLSLLSSGPSHGYELKGAFEAAVGPQWGSLNIGHLYQVLERLSRDGLVGSARVAQQVKPDRVVYEITDAGVGELRRWLAEPTPRTGGFRDDFFLKVMAAARSGDGDLLTSVLTTQRTFLLRELRNLQSLRRDPEHRDRVVRLLLTAAARHVEADLAFLDDVEHALLDDDGQALAGLAPVRPAGDATAARPERLEPPDRPGRSDRPDRPGRSDSLDRPGRSDSLDRSERSERSERSGRSRSSRPKRAAG